MCRFCCLLLSFFAVLGLWAQDNVDSVAWMAEDDIVPSSLTVDDVTDTTVTAEIFRLSLDTVFTHQAVFRSWRKSHPLLPSETVAPVKSRKVRAWIDTLLTAVREMPLDTLSRDQLYLYDMRLPLVSSGYVTADSSLRFFQQVQLQEEQRDRCDLPISHLDDQYERQISSEKLRHAARFNYASGDPRRFRYARRPFDVPTFETQIIDSRKTVEQVRLVEDDMELDFSQTALEPTWQSVALHADKWHWKGDHTLTMQQTALSDNWYKGGDNNMSVSGEQKLTVSRYDEEKKTTFEAILDLKLSGYYTKADTIHQMKVSDNELSLNMKYGYKAWKKWYYSTQLYAKTPVFDYYKSNSTECKSTFFAPLELNLSLGVDYQYTSPNKRFTYSLLLAPFSYDMKAVCDDRVEVTQYGIDEGDKTFHSFGSNITTKFEWKMSESASWSSRLYYYTTYHDIKVEFENTFSFKISRLFTARIYAYPRFDDTRDDKLEIKEMLTFGIGYQW